MARAKATDWPRCQAPRKDGVPCGSAVIKGTDGKPSATCAFHAPQLEAAPAAAEPAVSDEVAPVQNEPSIPVESLRAALRGNLQTEEFAGLVEELLLDSLRASKDVWTSCPHCQKKHPVNLPDVGTRAAAVTRLVEVLEGRAREAANDVEAELDREAQLVLKSIESMTDEELARAFVIAGREA